MNEDKGIVVGVDGSPAALEACRYGAIQADRLGVPLSLVHVLPDYVPIAAMPMVPDDLRSVGTTLLSEARRVAEDAAPRVAVSTIMRTGSAVRALVEASKDARIMVLGRESTPVWARVFTGAVSMGVAARALCPVVSVPASAGGNDAQQRGPVVVGLKYVDRDESLLRPAFQAARERGADLVVLHAWELPGRYDEFLVRAIDDVAWGRSLQQRIQTRVESLRAEFPDVNAEVRVVNGQPTHALREASRSAGLLLLSRHGITWSPIHLGGTARALLRVADCPVEILPPGAVAPPPEDLGLEHSGAPLT